MLHTGTMEKSAESSVSPPPGRPATINPDTVAGIALALFAEHGYEQVSMERIAQAAGIGRKSLYRYFTSKADLVWGGIGEAAAVTETMLNESHQAHTGLLGTLHAASIAAMHSLPDLEVTRGRLRLIAQQPELTAQAPLRLGKQYERVYRFLRQGKLDAQDADYLSVAFGSLSFTAWLRWAQSDEQSPAAHLSRALSVLHLPTDCPSQHHECR